MYWIFKVDMWTFYSAILISLSTLRTHGIEKFNFASSESTFECCQSLPLPKRCHLWCWKLAHNITQRERGRKASKSVLKIECIFSKKKREKGTSSTWSFMKREEKCNYSEIHDKNFPLSFSFIHWKGAKEAFSGTKRERKVFTHLQYEMAILWHLTHAFMVSSCRNHLTTPYFARRKFSIEAKKKLSWLRRDTLFAINLSSFQVHKGHSSRSKMVEEEDLRLKEKLVSCDMETCFDV